MMPMPALTVAGIAAGLFGIPRDARRDPRKCRHSATCPREFSGSASSATGIHPYAPWIIRRSPDRARIDEIRRQLDTALSRLQAGDVEAWGGKTAAWRGSPEVFPEYANTIGPGIPWGLGSFSGPSTDTWALPAQQDLSFGASIVIWDHDPWTLPGNRAIRLSPKKSITAPYEVTEAPGSELGQEG